MINCGGVSRVTWNCIDPISRKKVPLPSDQLQKLFNPQPAVRVITAKVILVGDPDLGGHGLHVDKKDDVLVIDKKMAPPAQVNVAPPAPIQQVAPPAQVNVAPQAPIQQVVPPAQPGSPKPAVLLPPVNVAPQAPIQQVAPPAQVNVAPPVRVNQNVAPPAQPGSPKPAVLLPPVNVAPQAPIQQVAPPAQVNVAPPVRVNQNVAPPAQPGSPKPAVLPPPGPVGPPVRVHRVRIIQPCGCANAERDFTPPVILHFRNVNIIRKFFSDQSNMYAYGLRKKPGSWGNVIAGSGALINVISLVPLAIVGTERDNCDTRKCQLEWDKVQSKIEKPCLFGFFAGLGIMALGFGMNILSSPGKGIPIEQKDNELLEFLLEEGLSKYPQAADSELIKHVIGQWKKFFPVKCPTHS